MRLWLRASVRIRLRSSVRIRLRASVRIRLRPSVRISASRVGAILASLVGANSASLVGATSALVGATRVLVGATRVLVGCDGASAVDAHAQRRRGTVLFLERVAPGGVSPPARSRLTRDVSFWRRGRVGRPGVRPREVLKIPEPTEARANRAAIAAGASLQARRAGVVPRASTAIDRCDAA